ncbi:MAG: T9SS type A sorting domain-containing protein [Flavipsychrobacter sp.]|nr:T9SS type A sorting domain-containing protein [Flavipsychrobacter sp.]
MKKAFLYILAFSYTVALNAKDGADGLTTGVVINGGGFPHFNPQGSKYENKSNYRLIAKTNTKHNGTWFQYNDSTTYKYSFGRSGQVNIDQPQYDESILFDEAVTYYYNATAGKYDNKLFRTQTFDNKTNNILSLRYSIWHTLTQAWKDSAKYSYKYITGTNKIDQTLFQLWVGGTWTHNVPSTLTYDGNKVVQINSLAYSASYTYDANNNIIAIEDKISDHGSGILYNNERKLYTYGSNNEVASYTLEVWNTTDNSWKKSKYWEYTYSAAKNVTESVEYNWNGTGWDRYSKHEYTYDANNNKTTDKTMLWNATSGSFYNYMLETWLYNTHGLVESITTISWDNTGNQWQYAASNTQTRYYYEYFATAIANTSFADNSIMKLYPIPATDILHISLNLPKTLDARFSILNMAGITVKQWSEENLQNNTLHINTEALPAGNYILNIQSDAAIASQRFVINK